MITVSKSTIRELGKQCIGWWHGEDEVHYGGRVNWKSKRFVFKAMDRGKIVGYTAGKYEAGVCFIDELIIDKKARGCGIGKALLNKVEEFAREMRAHKVYLYTGVDWEARKFYEKLGYTKTGDLPNHYFHHDFVIYCRII